MPRITIPVLLILAACLGPGAAHAQAGADSAALAVVREHVAAQNAHDLERIIATFGDSVELHSTTRRTAFGDTVMVDDRAQLRERYQSLFARFPGTRFEIVAMHHAGTFVSTRERMTGIPGAGELFGITVYRVRNGRIDAMWIFE